MLPSPPEIDRALCLLTAKLAPGQRPCLVILKTQILIHEARRGEKLQICVVEDYSPECFEPASQIQGNHGGSLQPSLLLPARLHITLPDRDNKSLFFN